MTKRSVSRVYILFRTIQLCFQDSVVKHLELDHLRVNRHPISWRYTISCNRNSSLQLTHIAGKHLNETKSTTRTSRLRTSVKWAFCHVAPRHLFTFRTSINRSPPGELCQVLGFTMATEYLGLWNYCLLLRPVTQVAEIT